MTFLCPETGLSHCPNAWNGALQHSAFPSYKSPTRTPTPAGCAHAHIEPMPSTQTLIAPMRAPSFALLIAEPMRALLDSFASHVTAHPQRVGDGHPVLVYPGLGAGAMNTSQMRIFLNRAGFQATDWGAGVNIGHEGDFDDWLAGLVANVRTLQAEHDGRKVSLVGWSLGGIFAREIAKCAP
jgi:hypothetical protein